MSSTRRSVLGVLGGVVSGSLAGCAGSTTTQVDLGVSNVTAESRSVTVEIVPASVDANLSENTVYTEQFDLGPQESAGSYVQREGVFAEQKALVRVRETNGYIGEYTFVPDCPADGRTDEAVELRLRGETQVQFSQNWCR